MTARLIGPLPRCPGEGRRWISGTGSPICPVCHCGPRGMDVRPPVRRRGRWTGQVAVHGDRRYR
jgi:hypothetical protein